MPITSKTDWIRVKHEAATDTPVAWDAESDVYDPNNAQTVNAFWNAAEVKTSAQRDKNQEPAKEQVAIRFSPEVLAAFRASGKGWQTRMDEALKDWLKTHSPIA